MKHLRNNYRHGGYQPAPALIPTPPSGPSRIVDHYKSTQRVLIDHLNDAERSMQCAYLSLSALYASDQKICEKKRVSMLLDGLVQSLERLQWAAGKVIGEEE